MPSVINTNIYSLNAQRNLNRNDAGLATALQRLSSGLRVNSSVDDAAGLAVAAKMEAQMRGLSVAMRNASDGISYAQSADSALASVSDTLQRMRELATQSLNGAIGDTERGFINNEYSQLQAEADRIQGAAKLNGATVFSTFSFQVGADSGQSLSATFSSTSVSGTSVGTTAAASTALASVDAWINSMASNRSTIGGVQSRLNSTITYLEAARENQAAARSRIMDADFAAETANLTRYQILQQAGTAMVSQANAIPNNVLSLLR
ncbi:MAG: flagellin [Pseudomonadota bacterium]|jgi:flagellin|uniref:Flagellin n=1 Tax=Candidatus Proximibacter danicus TaxID=2954365 RepID=A0A9D7JYI3_9PROT|nr:flagellin FliC [Candidatus Proximibacter danicus]MDQ5904448.1 flagellin [Pseudomonadota bacterium]MDQ5945473.1 flagellin [Pseudomonadota bacterium]